MLKRYTIAPEAVEESREAYDYYEQRGEGLGAEFLTALEEAIQKIRQQPELYRVVKRGFRKVKLKRFPYLIIYDYQDDFVTVHSVFQGYRNPDKWPGEPR